MPDGLLFAGDEAKRRANAVRAEWERYRFGAAVVESKRWRRPLDRRSGRPDERTAPSSQILRYLRRVDDLTHGALRWGVLTNGAEWRLYYAGAQSVSEQFFEIDLATSSRPSPRNTGRRSTISAASSTAATPPPACRPATAACSTRRGSRCWAASGSATT